AQQRSIVIKANEGDANIGIEIYTPERIERLRGETLEQRIRQHLNTWRKEEPVLIQEYISPSIHAETPSPCIQALITAKGQTHVIGIASQLVGPNGRYQGAEVSPHLFPPTVRECLFAVANAVGEAAAAQGYRGFFGIDTVLDEHGVLYCIEMNARRIASLVLFDVAREVSCQYGLRASDLSLRCENLNLAGQPYATLHSRLTPLLFPKEGKPEGVLFVGTPTGASGAFKLLAISEEIRTSRALCLQARALLGGSDSL
ncbi:MAG: hypothetical protein J2P36_35950, partial [Ktedonobacteraceae bacterium]|nr:hypothetical protein [Ktedonobacteraceae bacterium]